MVSEFDVEMAYKYLLGRPPENRDVVVAKAAGHDSLDDLRRAMFRSAEFRQKLAAMTASAAAAGHTTAEQA